MRLKTRSLFYVMIVCLASMLNGCKEAEPTIFYQLSLSENGVAFDMEGGSKSIQVNPFPDSEHWEAVYAVQENWFSFSKDDNSLIVTADPNYAVEPRTGSIVIVSPDGNFDPVQVCVMQEAAEPLEYTTTVSDHQFDSEGGEVFFTVSSNYDWSLEYDADWLTVYHYVELDQIRIECIQNESEERRSAILTFYFGADLDEVYEVEITQETRSENRYLNLLGQWEITAAKWYYSPNGSLNSLEYNPNQLEYYLVFSLEQGEYGKTYMMRDFLYPGTSLEVRYDKESGNIVIPFGWTVYSYDVFLYLTLVSNTQFSYASLEVDGIPSEDFTTISLDLPKVDGWNYIGFGLWTYNDNGGKVAVGSRSYPTMFPMGPIVFRKWTI